MRTLAVVATILGLMQCSSAQTPLPGTWEGAIHVGGMNLGIQVTFHDSLGNLSGTIDIPQQGAHGLQLNNITHAGSIVHFELPTGLGVATFDGVLASDSLTGLFAQSNAKGTFQLLPAAIASARSIPEPPPPYVQEEVSFKDKDITLAGTLTMPRPPGRHPAVLLLTGSGPENRDEDIFGFKIFKVIADRLTRDGVAVLRFDDRGVGGSTGTQADCTTEDYAQDALSGITFLKSDPRIDPMHVGIIGHSEGATASSIAASRSPNEVSCIVLLAGPGLRGDSAINSQIVELSRQAGETAENVRKNLALQRKVYETIRKAGDMTEIKQELDASASRAYAAMTPEQRASIRDSAAYVATTVERVLAGTRSRWFRRFIDIDPAIFLQNVHCPVLAVFGELDQQVYPSLNRPPMEKALSGNKDVTYVLIPKANHLFQTAQTGSPTEYGSLPKSFTPGVLDTISSWLHARLLPKN